MKQALLSYRGKAVPWAEGESALEALERAAIGPPSGCRSGVCGACLLRVVDGAAPAEAQAGLPPQLARAGVVFTCRLRGARAMALSDLDEAHTSRAAVLDLRLLGRDVVRVRLKPEVPFAFEPGQYVVISRGDGLERSYSIASLPEEGVLDLHVRRVPAGALSPWFFDTARPGDRLLVRGPLGSCTYQEGRPEQPLLLVGAGTGLAPLYGILRQALAKGHLGPIHLYHGARDPSGLYLTEELASLQARHPQLRVEACVLSAGEGHCHGRIQPLEEAVLADHPSLCGWRVFLCGDAALVHQMRRAFFLAGASSGDLFSDPFALPTPARSQAPQKAPGGAPTAS